MILRTYWISAVKRAHTFARIIRRHIFVISICAAGILLASVLWVLYTPQAISFNFGSPHNCRVSPRLFPTLSKTETKGSFALSRPPSLSIGSFALYSHRVCAVATSGPQANAVTAYNERLFGWPLLGHSLQVTTKGHPAISSPLSQRQLLPPDGIVRLTLNQPDITFTYVIKTSEQSAPCRTTGSALSCELKPLRLAYAQKYDLKILRQFHAKTVSELAQAPIQTLTPIGVAAVSIAAGSVVQHKPTELVIETDKILTGMGQATLIALGSDKTETAIPTTAAVSGKTVKVTFGQELARKTAFEVRLTSLTAADGSGLAGTSYVLPFSTSGGPKVSAINIGGRNVATTQALALTFDQMLLAGQDPAPLVSLLVGGQAQPMTVRVSGNKLLATPVNPLPLCATFTITVTAGVQSQFGISGDSAWSINSRAICYATFNIGTSVRGRPITAYKFGDGANPVVYLGAMHGSEANSKTIMTEWFNELNANPGRLSTRSLVVIPAVNPDGIAASSRLNANNVDINRNFPASDWKSVVTSPSNPNPMPAGGPAPLSEPESRAVAAYIQQTRPRLVMAFHSAAAIVEANEAGDSVSLAATYAAKARYRAVPKSQSAPVFQYDTTGAMEDWMRSSMGSPAIVVELLSRTASEFSRNRDALWYTVGL